MARLNGHDYRTLQQYMTTTEAAEFFAMKPNNFAKWAASLGVEPAHRVRVGRSWHTIWDMLALCKTERGKARYKATYGVNFDDPAEEVAHGSDPD